MSLGREFQQTQQDICVTRECRFEIERPKCHPFQKDVLYLGIRLNPNIISNTLRYSSEALILLFIFIIYSVLLDFRDLQTIEEEEMENRSDLQEENKELASKLSKLSAKLGRFYISNVFEITKRNIKILWFKSENIEM